MTVLTWIIACNIIPIYIAQADAFKWGTATASYQIEGAVNEDGRLPSIWDTFSSTPNKVHKNETGEIADDNYHRFLEDIQLMKNLNLKHYRLSFSWPRIIPDGKNINTLGIDHYNKVINALLDAGIEPFVTLYHWDLPQSIYDITNGGWNNESIVPFFELYAKTVFDAFNGRVKYWLTFNEPWTFCVIGYDYGVHAPGRCTGCDPFGGNSSVEVYQCAHNVLLSHAAAVKYFRAQQYDINGGSIGITLNVDWAEPASSNTQDYEASQRRLIWECAWFADAIYFGDYPQVMKEYIGDRLPVFTDVQKEDLNGSHDFFGLNHYTTKWIVASDKYEGQYPNWATDQRNSDSACNQYNNTPIGVRADSDWLWVVPYGIYNVIQWIDERYNHPPIFITENGCDVPNEDIMPLKDVLNDTFRIKYYDQYISMVTKAKYEGADVRGYFAWSLMDNFEWADGYSKRFGLHFVNYSDNLTRTAKESAKWFSHYVNEWNPNAEYKEARLSPISVPTQYADIVCPIADSDKFGMKIVVVVLVTIVIVGSVVGGYMFCRRRELKEQILMHNVIDDNDDEDDNDDREKDVTKHSLMKNQEKSNVGDMYKIIESETR